MKGDIINTIMFIITIIIITIIITITIIIILAPVGMNGGPSDWIRLEAPASRFQ